MPPIVNMETGTEQRKYKVDGFLGQPGGELQKFVRENCQALFDLWNVAILSFPSRDKFETDEQWQVTDTIKTTHDGFMKGLDVLTLLLLDNAKDVLNRSQVYLLEESVSPYLSDEDYEKYATEIGEKTRSKNSE